jgi:hypothetical protein
MRAAAERVQKAKTTMIDRTYRQLEALQDYLAAVPRDRVMTLSAQVARDAAAGNIAARRLVASGLLESPGDRGVSSVTHPVSAASRPIASVAVSPLSPMERHARNASLVAMVRRQRKLAL